MTCIGPSIFGRPEILRGSKDIGFWCQRSGDAWTRAVGQPKRRTFCGLSDSKRWKRLDSRWPGLGSIVKLLAEKRTLRLPLVLSMLAVKSLDSRHPRHVTSLPIGDITPQAWENMTCLRPQGLQHSKTQALEGSRMDAGGRGGALWESGDKNVFAYKSLFLIGFWILLQNWTFVGRLLEII